MPDTYDGLTKGDIVTERSFEESGEVTSKAIGKVYGLKELGSIGLDGTPEFKVTGLSAIPTYELAIAQGLDPDVFREYKFGRNNDVGGTEVAVAGISDYVFPTTAATITITSNDVNDTPAGAGARNVHIYGLDANYDLQNEIINVGDTTTNTYTRLFRMHVETCGTPNPLPTVTGVPPKADANNFGTITATHNGTTLPIATIEPGVGQTLMAIYTIPNGYTAYMYSANSTSSEGKSVVTQLKTRDITLSDAPFRTKGIRDSFQNQVGTDFEIPSKFEEKTDILFTAISSASGTKVSSAFLMILVKNV